MHRLWIVIAMVGMGVGLVACGDDGTPSVESAGDAMEAMGDAAHDMADDMGETADELAAQARETAEGLRQKAADALSAEGQSCLDLVKANSFAKALPVCLSAAQADPDNTEIQAALERAQAQTQVAADEAAESALEGLNPLGE